MDLQDRNFNTRFEKVKEENPKYWAHRYEYLKMVYEIAKVINPKKSVEIGTNGFQILHNSITIDINKKISPDICIDLTKEKLPFEDKEIDLFIGLQVFEHLGNSQEKVFKEILRTSKKCILSFPYLWHCPKDPSHHNLNHDTFKKWTLNKKTKEIIINSARAFYIFDLCF